MRKWKWLGLRLLRAPPILPNITERKSVATSLNSLLTDNFLQLLRHEPERPGRVQHQESQTEKQKPSRSRQKGNHLLGLPKTRRYGRYQGAMNSFNTASKSPPPINRKKNKIIHFTRLKKLVGLPKAQYLSSNQRVGLLNYTGHRL